MSVTIASFQFTYLEVLFGLLGIVGIILFIVACWHNIKHPD